MDTQSIELQLGNQFEEWKRLSNVLYAVKEHFWGVINIQDGRMVFPCRFDSLLFRDDEIILSQKDIWGYLGEDGLDICPKYESVIFYSDGYSLATIGSTAPFTKNPMPSFDLFDDAGDLLIGSIKGFRYIQELGLFQFFVGGHYSLRNDEFQTGFDFDPSGGRYIITDKSLRSFFPQEDGSYYQFPKGTYLSLKSTLKKAKSPSEFLSKEKKYLYEANFPIEISLRGKLRYVDNYLLTCGKASSRAINLLSRKSTREFDKIQSFDKGFFVVEEQGLIGVIDEDNRPIIPIKYDVLTRPVNGYVLGFQFKTEITKNGKSFFDISSKTYCKIYLINTKELDSEPRLVSFRPSLELSEYESLKREYYLLHCVNDKTGPESLSVRAPEFFNEDFASLISKAPFKDETQIIHSVSNHGFFASLRQQYKESLTSSHTNSVYWFSSSRFNKNVDSQEEQEKNEFCQGEGFHNHKHFADFNGSYAQEVEGYADEDIYDSFDGEPDAYWNID